MRKGVGFYIICYVFLVIGGIAPLFGQSHTINQRSRAIHIVYDDSGSMIRSNNEYLDRWGQAKYAMEVFAVMLEEKDAMRVY